MQCEWFIFRFDTWTIFVTIADNKNKLEKSAAHDFDSAEATDALNREPYNSARMRKLHQMEEKAYIKCMMDEAGKKHMQSYVSAKMPTGI